MEEVRQIQGALPIINPTKKKNKKKQPLGFQHHLFLLKTTVICVTIVKFGNSTALYEAHLTVVEARPSYH